jgi:hypothetical protein
MSREAVSAAEMRIKIRAEFCREIWNQEAIDAEAEEWSKNSSRTFYAACPTISLCSQPNSRGRYSIFLGDEIWE